VSNKTWCDYGRCGGTGRREVKKRRYAQLIVLIDEAPWYVCESCADLLIRDATAEGRQVEKLELEGGHGENAPFRRSNT
jgi:hypothetical protein